jgi:hypothetical protein
MSRHWQSALEPKQQRQPERNEDSRRDHRLGRETPLNELHRGCRSWSFKNVAATADDLADLRKKLHETMHAKQRKESDYNE